MIKKKMVTLNPGESKIVVFEVTPSVPKAYQVAVNGLSGSFSATRVSVAGSIGTGLIWSKSLEYWHHVTTGMEIPLNEEISLAPMWINDSGINIVGHVELSVTYPDGTRAFLSAVQNQDKEATPGNGWHVRFAPFLSTQEGTYTLEATLFSGGQVLDSVTFTLVAILTATEFYMSPITVILGDYIEGIGQQFRFSCVITNNGDTSGTRKLTFVGYHGGAVWDSLIKNITLEPGQSYTWKYMQWLLSGSYKVTLTGDWKNNNYAQVTVYQ